MIEYKQPQIVEELKRRIAEKEYVGTLPTSAELAAEFGVNIKTMNKAIGQLVAAGQLERRRHCGTTVKFTNNAPAQQMVEVIFEGFTTVFTHPFWGEIWGGLVEKISLAGYRPILTMLESDPTTGLLCLDQFKLCDSAGKVVLGISEKRLLDAVRAAKVPFITACDELDDSEIPSVYFDFSAGIAAAIDHLQNSGCRRIAFIGQTQSYVNPMQLQKFNHYLRAVQKYRQVEPELIANVRPLADQGGPAMRAILKQTTPDAVLAAYDHQVPGIMAVLREKGLELPVIGCDGLILPELAADRHVVSAPRRKCGELAADLLLKAIKEGRKIKRQALPAEFR